LISLQRTWTFSPKLHKNEVKCNDLFCVSTSSKGSFSDEWCPKNTHVKSHNLSTTHVKISHLVASLPTSRQQDVFALLVTSLEQVVSNLWQVVSNLWQPCWYYHTCCKVVPTRPIQSYTSSSTHVKTHKLLQDCKQVVTNLFTSCQQVVFALLAPSCCNKFGTSC
jgi:hypothetical protein